MRFCCYLPIPATITMYGVRAYFEQRRGFSEISGFVFQVIHFAISSLGDMAVYSFSQGIEADIADFKSSKMSKRIAIFKLSMYVLWLQIDEIRKVIFEMRTVLYGDERSEPVEDACAKLTQEFFKEDTFRMLIASLPTLDPGTRQDITHVIANLQRQRANGRCVASDYLECNTDILDKLLRGCDDLELALAYGAILRECIRHQVAAKYILESDQIKKFFMYVQDPCFDKASDAAATFRASIMRLFLYLTS